MDTLTARNSAAHCLCLFASFYYRIRVIARTATLRIVCVGLRASPPESFMRLSRRLSIIQPLNVTFDVGRQENQPRLQVSHPRLQASQPHPIRTSKWDEQSKRRRAWLSRARCPTGPIFRVSAFPVSQEPFPTSSPNTTRFLPSMMLDVRAGSSG